MKQILLGLLVFLIIAPIVCAETCDLKLQTGEESTCGNYKIRHDYWGAGANNPYQIAHFHLWRLSPYADLGSDSIDQWDEQEGKYYDGNRLHVSYTGASAGPPRVAKYKLDDLPPQLVIKGNLYYKDRDLNDVPAKWALVSLYDYDYADGSYDSLINYYISTDENGYFESSPMNNIDWDEDGGKLDIVVDFMASNPNGCVIDAAGYPYHCNKGVYENVSDKLYMSWYTPDDKTQKAWWVYDTLYQGWNYLYDTVGYDMNYVEIYWQWGHDADYGTGIDMTHWSSGTSQNPGPFIYLDGMKRSGDGGGSANDPDVIIHEYGHCVMYKVFEDDYPPYDCSYGHWMNGVSEPGCAWTEGWAHFMPLAVFDDKYITDTTYFPRAFGTDTINLETRNGKLNFPDGDSCEGNVAAALWDMIDSNNEDYDDLTADFSEIWDVLQDQTTDEDTFRDFYDSWCDLGHDRSKANAVIFQNRINYNDPPCANINMPESLHGYAEKIAIAVWTTDTDGILPDIAIFYTRDNTNWHQLDLSLKSGGYSTRSEERWRYFDWDTKKYIDEDDSVWVRVTAVDDLGASSDNTVGPFTVDNVAPHNWRDFSPTDWVVDQTPDCTIEVKDNTSGLDVSTAYYKYSTDGGSSWSSWTSASCTGSDGATSYQTIIASDVPFDRDSGTQNRIKFRIDDAVENTGESDEYTVRVDATDPPAPVISSSTYPDEGEWHTNNDPSLTWTTPSDTSGISCYSYTLDQSATTTPNTTCEPAGNSKAYTDVADGIWYFHLIAKDNAGNWGGADHYMVKIGGGEASTTDAVIALQIAAGSREYDSCWDASGDGSVTSLDALMILQAAGSEP